MTKATFVMAVYNGEQTIAQAIYSVINQDESDWNLIIVDDCSNDTTGKIIEKYLHDERITVITNKKNMGSGYSRNLAVAQADSPWIAVQDADDLSLPNRLSKQLAFAEKHVNVDVISGQVMEFGSWGGPVAGSWPMSPEEISNRYEKEKMPVAHCASLIRKTAIVDAGGYDADCRRAQDFALFRRMNKPRFMAVPQVLLFYRTERPLPLSYAIASGRYGRLARIKTRSDSPITTAKVQSFPGSIFTDLRSLITWSRRRINERSFDR